MSGKMQRINTVRSLKRLAVRNLQKEGDTLEVIAVGQLFALMQSRGAKVTVELTAALNAHTHVHLDGTKLIVELARPRGPLAGHGASAQRGSRK